MGPMSLSLATQGARLGVEHLSSLDTREQHQAGHTDLPTSVSAPRHTAPLGDAPQTPSQAETQAAPPPRATAAWDPGGWTWAQGPPQSRDPHRS